MRIRLFAFGIFFSCLVFLNGFGRADEDNCKSARTSLQEQVPERIVDVSRANVLNLNMLKEISAVGPQGNMPGYECWATVQIWSKSSNSPKTVRVIYTVFNINQFQGMPIEVSSVGVAHVCGESAEWDRLYTVCNRQ